MNIVPLSTPQYTPNTKNLITTKQDWEKLKICISLHFVKMHPHFYLSYGILVRKYKNVTIITLQIEQENALKMISNWG
jgi:hypothetical protein